MEVRKLKINDPHGLHLRRAAKVVEIAQKHKAKIYLCHKCKLAEGCSILALLTLAATKDAEVAIIAEGSDEKEAIRNICTLFEEK